MNSMRERAGSLGICPEPFFSGGGKKAPGLLLACFFLLISAAPAAEVDWGAVEEEAGRLLSRYIQINTTNPPGNETAAARFFQEKFSQEGISAQVLESQPGRGIVYARLEGTGEKKAVVLLNHLDVVPASKEDGWQVDPFAGVIRDGYVYGRGAVDCKGVGVVEFLAMALLKRSGRVLKRDVVFLGTADEEVGGKWGAGWFVENHFNLIADAEFLLNEGGGIRIEEKGRTYYVDVAEKAPCWIRMEATGPAGHGSVPLPETAVVRLIRALEKIRLYETKIKVVPVVQKFFSALAEKQAPEKQKLWQNLASALQDPEFRREFTANPLYNALVRNTIALTVLRGSSKINVIPARAVAELDCRLLPGEDPQAFVNELKRVVGDPRIRFSVLLNFPPLASEAGTELFRAIERVAARRDPGALVIPAVLSGFTDSHYFRRKGIVSYGFTALALKEEDFHRIHGVDERIPLQSLREGVRTLLEVLEELGQ